MDINNIIAHRLTILQILGLDVANVATTKELADKILKWLKSQPERMEKFKNRMARELFIYYDGHDMLEVALKGFKGLNNYTDEDWLNDIDAVLGGQNGASATEDLIDLLY